MSCPLTEVPLNTQVIVDNFSTETAATRRLQELGIIQGSIIKTLRKSPLNSHIQIDFENQLLAISFHEAASVLVSTINS